MYTITLKLTLLPPQRYLVSLTWYILILSLTPDLYARCLRREGYPHFFTTYITSIFLDFKVKNKSPFVCVCTIKVVSL